MSGTGSPTGDRGLLRGVHVLSTRAREDAASLRAALEILGATVHDLPAIAIRPRTSSAELRSALERLDSFDWIAFTSRNAVRALFDAAAELGNLGTPMARLAAVGPATTAALEERGLAVACVARDTSARGLGAALQEAGVVGSSVLLPLGDLALPELRAALEGAGAQVEVVVAYDTVMPAEPASAELAALRARTIDVIAFSSPSAVRNLAEMLGDDALPVLRAARSACIGPTTASALEEMGVKPAAVSREQSVAGLVSAVVRAAAR